MASRPPRPRLSVCCMTVHPPALVAASLGFLRATADEIVVAVDSRVPVDELGPLVDVADQVVRYEFREPVDRPRAWLMSQCLGEWILTIDGDEVVSPELVDALPELTRARDVLQHHFPRRWLFSSATTWLDQLPWWPDFQIRLVRNDATLAPRSGVHGGITPVLPARHVETPLYHLDLLLRTESERQAKADLYEAQNPGQRAFGGGLLNQVLYRPEQAPTLELTPVPVADRAWIDQSLAAVTSSTTAVAVPLVPAADIDALAPSNRLPDDAYHANLVPFERNLRMVAGELRPIYLWVTNKGTATWPWGADQHPEIRVSYHWRTVRDRSVVVFDGHRSPPPERIGPGQTALVPVWVQAPAEPGRYLLELDLVHEHVRWFEQPLTIEVPVEDERPC